MCHFIGALLKVLLPVWAYFSSTSGSLPYHENSPSYISFLHFDVPICLMALIFHRLILIPWGVNICLNNLHSIVFNCILSALNFRFLPQAISSKLGTAMLLFISLYPLANTSSAMLVTPGTVLVTASSLSWKTSELTDRLIGSCNHLYFPQGVLNIISNEFSLSSWTIQ